MFRGVNQVNMDAKGRVAVPSRYRERLVERCSGHLVVTIDDVERCLLLYPVDEWEEIQEQIDNLPSYSKQAKRLKRLLVGHASDVEMDANGRVLLPPLLREYAGLDKRVILLGQGRKFEVWDEERWNGLREIYLQEENEDSEAPDEALMKLSL